MYTYSMKTPIKGPKGMVRPWAKGSGTLGFPGWDSRPLPIGSQGKAVILTSAPIRESPLPTSTGAPTAGTAPTPRKTAGSPWGGRSGTGTKAMGTASGKCLPDITWIRFEPGYPKVPIPFDQGLDKGQQKGQQKESPQEIEDPPWLGAPGQDLGFEPQDQNSKDHRQLHKDAPEPNHKKGEKTHGNCGQYAQFP